MHVITAIFVSKQPRNTIGTKNNYNLRQTGQFFSLSVELN